MAASPVILYAAPWCSKCRRVRLCLEETGVAFREVNPEEDSAAAAALAARTGGSLDVPAVQAGERFVVDPDDAALTELLGVAVAQPADVYDVAFVGAGPAGLTGAIYTAREGLRTVVLEKGLPGGQAAATDRIDNYPGFPEPVGGPELMDRVRRQAERFGAEILTGREVEAIDVSGAFFSLRTGAGTVRGRGVVVTTGSVYRRLGVPGEEPLLGRGISFCATCDAPFYRNRPLVVAGGGNSALQETVHLAGFASRITLVQLLDRLTGSKVLQDRVRSLPNVEILLSHRVTRVAGETAVEGVEVEDLVQGGSRTLAADGLFVFVGLAPNTAFLQGLVDLDEQGFVVTDPRTLATSVPGVFAAGDARAGSSKQITTAVGEGTVAAFLVQKWLADRNRCVLGDRPKERP
ncbi:MAG: FAD-dependent oxidoreductase [Deltaproteobacteria bacterium]|nr:FAD-dependent oxidoreductase [Deltaproteobacteria bacterium]